MGARIDLWLYMQCSTCIYAVCIYRHYRHHRAHQTEEPIAIEIKENTRRSFLLFSNCFFSFVFCVQRTYNQIELLHYYLSFCIDSWIRLFLFAKWGSIFKWLHSFMWSAVGTRWWWKNLNKIFPISRWFFFMTIDLNALVIWTGFALFRRIIQTTGNGLDFTQTAHYTILHL